MNPSAPSGEILRIWLRPGARQPLREVVQARAIAEVGIDGDHASPGSKRQVTLLSEERWRDACSELGRDVDPSARRANLLVRGLALDLRRGQVLLIGDETQLRIEGETRPCELLDDHGGLGLNAALRTDVRGGLYGRVLQGGALRVGDSVRWVTED